MLTQHIFNVRDQTAMGQIKYEFDLVLPTPTTTVREVIAQRVRKEVEDFQLQKKVVSDSLVKPLEVELILNKHKARKMSPEKQVNVALEAFHNNGFFMLVDDKQVTELDHRIDKSSTVSFIKLVPLVGG